MSYCRFSCDNWKCDVYVYESCYGGYDVYVAGNRFVDKLPEVPFILDVPHEVWFSAHQANMAAVKESEVKDIGGKYDGDYFNYDTLEELYAGLLDIQSEGYHVPEWVFIEIDEELHGVYQEAAKP